MGKFEDRLAEAYRMDTRTGFGTSPDTMARALGLDGQRRGAIDIALERERQVNEEGYDAEHDAGASPELAIAGACYAAHEWLDMVPDAWPWSREAWKPKDRRSNLVRAGALIAAAIDALPPEGDDR